MGKLSFLVVVGEHGAEMGLLAPSLWLRERICLMAVEGDVFGNNNAC